MKTIISAFLFLGILSVNAQQNIFLHNDFWDEETTIKQVKEAIENGNDPVAFSESNFDATAYAILNNSPLETLLDRKSTRLNSSHVRISYAVFCLKKKRRSLT